MTPFEKLLQSLVANWRLDLAILGKAAVILLLLLYLVFTLVVFRQVQLMNATISGLMNRWLALAAGALVLLALTVLITGWIIL